jgi:hypothetical protein
VKLTSCLDIRHQADFKSSAPALRPALHAFALFHLNLAFSSIEEEQRPIIVRDCYRPLLELAKRHPIGIEATAYTLEAIRKCDPAWLLELAMLIHAGKVEFIGSGFAQAIGPLLPAEVAAVNLRLGNQAYRDMLGVMPKLALVNEQAYAGGLVAHYLDAGYRALLVDWDNVANSHPGWTADYRYAPQRARGSDGREIGLIWTNTVAFQKVQRLAHDDIALDDYLAFVAGQRGDGDRSLCLYASDAEIFGFRPGRYRTEEANQGGKEWQRLAEALGGVAAMEGVELVLPSDTLAVKNPAANNILRLESAAYPVPVKKQRKYNLTRWAVTGRDDVGVNAACQRIYAALKRSDRNDADWRELCRLWSSDFRTHITEARWQGYCRDLAAMEVRLKTQAPPALPTVCGETISERYVDIATPTIKARLDRRRGLAIQSAAFAPDFMPLIGGIPHGHFDDIALQADWYTGDCVFEAPGEPKVTDLDWATARMEQMADGSLRVMGEIATPLGPIVKIMTFHADIPRIDFDLEFRWQQWGRGSLRLAHVTLLGEAFDEGSLSFAAHNGGTTPDRFLLKDQIVEHGAPVSFLVSASCALGLTEGRLELADARHRVTVLVDRETAPLVGLINHRRTGGKLFCQAMLSALELDDTRKPAPYREGPRRFRFSIEASPA